MAIGTYEQYKERLLNMKPNVYLNGKKIDRSNGKTGAGESPAYSRAGIPAAAHQGRIYRCH